MEQQIIYFLSKYREYLILVDALLIGLGSLWQWHLLTEIDRHHRGSAYRMLPRFIAKAVPQKIPRRAVIPYIFGFFIIMGTIAYTYVEYNTSRFWLDYLIRNIWFALLFTALITAKAWFGPILLTYSIVVILHQLSHGSSDWTWMPELIQDMMDPIFDHLPKVVYIAYNVLVLSYIAVTSLYDTLVPFGSVVTKYKTIFLDNGKFCREDR